MGKDQHGKWRTVGSSHCVTPWPGRVADGRDPTALRLPVTGATWPASTPAATRGTIASAWCLRPRRRSASVRSRTACCGMPTLVPGAVGGPAGPGLPRRGPSDRWRQDRMVRNDGLDGRHSVGYGRPRTIGDGAAHGNGADRGRQGAPGQMAGPDLAVDLDKRRRGRNLASKLLLAAGAGGDLQHSCQRVLTGRGVPGNPPPGEQPLSGHPIQGPASPEAGKQ